ncbi:hypothetical protein MRX96_025127 [Rhipicephalus microplus]
MSRCIMYEMKRGMPEKKRKEIHEEKAPFYDPLRRASLAALISKAVHAGLRGRENVNGWRQARSSGGFAVKIWLNVARNRPNPVGVSGYAMLKREDSASEASLKRRPAELLVGHQDGCFRRINLDRASYRRIVYHCE